MRFLLAGGGTAGHVNPLLALAESLQQAGHEVVALGTKEGLESRLVPQRGFQLLTIPRLPLPRKLSVHALTFPFRLVLATVQVLRILRKQRFDGVVGFGGYVSTPAYLAAAISRVPLVVHEANARAGFANRLGARFTKYIAVCFPNTNLPAGRLVGMPLRPEFARAREIDQKQARIQLGLDPTLPTLLVTGGSQGARSINTAVEQSREDFKRAGIQVLHIVGPVSGLEEISEPSYKRLVYCDAMADAIAASSFAISRAGAATVSEFTACGLPALYVPYPVGNGEQRYNIEQVLSAGGGLIVTDRDLNAEFIKQKIIPLLADKSALATMANAAKSVAILDGTAQLQEMLMQAVNT